MFVGKAPSRYWNEGIENTGVFCSCGQKARRAMRGHEEVSELPLVCSTQTRATILLEQSQSWKTDDDHDDDHSLS